MRQEWKELVDVEKKYSIDEAIEKYNEVMEFLRSKKIRIIMTAQGKRQPLENEVHLSDEDKRKYTFKYLMLSERLFWTSNTGTFKYERLSDRTSFDISQELCRVFA